MADRMIRVLEYVGPREWIEQTLDTGGVPAQGVQVFEQGRKYIRSGTLGNYPEPLDVTPRDRSDFRDLLDVYHDWYSSGAPEFAAELTARLDDWFNTQAQALGYRDWEHAYHSLHAATPEPEPIADEYHERRPR